MFKINLVRKGFIWFTVSPPQKEIRAGTSVQKPGQRQELNQILWKNTAYGYSTAFSV